VETLTVGTKEYLPIQVRNILGSVTTLDGTGLTYDLYHDDEAETVVLTAQPASNDGMVALPLIDCTGLTEGDYKVFIKFTALPEVPRLGPFYFRVDD
jgi:hypothetical protein